MIEISKYYISIDGGGSKTDIVVFNQNMQLMLKQRASGMNINQIGEAKFSGLFAKIANDLKVFKNYKLCIGLPGYGESNETDMLQKQIIGSFFDLNQCLIVNDVELAHYGSLGLTDGILILSGTGSIAMRLENGNKTRVGGWGHLIGDEGSGFDIGYQTINHISRVFDELDEESELSKMICEKYQFDFASKVINYIYSSTDYRYDVARLSQIVGLAAENGCPKAIEIIESAAESLIEYAYKLRMNDEVVSYAGSVFKCNTLKEWIRVQTDFELSEPKLIPVLGGVLKLYDEDGLLKDKEKEIQLIKEVYSN